MARIRTIKPDFWRDEDLSEITAEASLLAIGLLNVSDDEGYFSANPKLIEADVFPLRELSITTPLLINELIDIGYIRLFIGIDGKKYGQVVNFLKHQVISKKTDSKIKGLDKFMEDSSSTTGVLHAGRERKGRERKGKGKGKDSSTEPSLNAKVEVEVENQYAIIPSQDEDNAKATAQDADIVILFPLNTKAMFPILKNQHESWSELYPAVDVIVELRKMKGWLDANPSKRKTKTGILKFANSWLAKAQDNPQKIQHTWQGNRQTRTFESTDYNAGTEGFVTELEE